MQSTMTSTFSERLKIILDETGIRQTDLCDKAGIGKSAMSQYLHGAFVPKQAKLNAIAEALGVSEGWLMGYDVPRMRSVRFGQDGILDKGNAEGHMELISLDDSMAGAYIPKGARVVLKKFSEEDKSFEDLNGDIVGIAVNGGRTQLRFLHKDGDMLLATAANPAYPPQVFELQDIESEQFEILGIVERVEIRF